jgi:hypothetical protein
LVTELPEWVPAEIRPFVRVAEGDRLLVDLRRVNVDRVEFDEIPDGWNIEITDPGRQGPVIIGAARPGTRVTWHFQRCGSHPVTIERGLRSVRLSEPPHTTIDRVRLNLTKNGTKLWFLSPGTYVVNSAVDDPVTYQARTEVANPAAVIAISGTARLTSLRGSGVVELEDTELDQLVFDGSLRAKMVSIKNLALTGKLTCTHLIADSVQAEQIEVHPPPQSVSIHDHSVG